MTLKELLLNPDSFVSTVTMAYIRKFGLEALDWDPLVSVDSMKEWLEVDNIPKKTQDKLNCGITIVGTTGYYDRIEVFVPCNMVLSGRQFTEGLMGMDDPYSLLWGVFEAVNMTEDKGDHPEFHPDIARYCGEVLWDAAITDPPEILRFADFDPVKMERLKQATMESGVYLSRQTYQTSILTGYLQKRKARMIEELQQMSSLLPLQQEP